VPQNWKVTFPPGGGGGGAGTVTWSVTVVDWGLTPVPVPWMVMEWLPCGAVAPTWRVRIEVVAVGAEGLNPAVTPVGSPVAESVTAPVKPPDLVMVTVVCPDSPCSTESVAGLTASAKAGVATTTSFTVRVRFTVLGSSPVAVARIVTVTGPPTAAPAAAVSVRFPEVAPPAMVSGETVTPAGTPSAVTCTAPVKPPLLAIVIVTFPVAPWSIVIVEGAIATVKAATGPFGSVVPPLEHAASPETPREARASRRSIRAIRKILHLLM